MILVIVKIENHEARYLRIFLQTNLMFNNEKSSLNNESKPRFVPTNYELMAIKKIAGDSIIAFFVILFLTMCMFYVLGYFQAMPRNLRGNHLISKAALRYKILWNNRKYKYKSYQIVGVPYPHRGENLHTMISGTTGSGKTVIISDLVSQIISRGDRAIIFDKMGTYLEKFYRPDVDVILNPFDRRSHSWNFFNEVDCSAHLESIATALIPNDGNAADPFWVKSARAVFVEVCEIIRKNGNSTTKEMIKVLLLSDFKSLAKFLRNSPVKSIIDINSPKTALSVMSVLSAYLKCLKYVENNGAEFSIRQYISTEGNNGCLFISSKADIHQALLPLVSAWVEVAANSILNQQSVKNNQKTWIILDELPSLHYLPSLELGLAESRQFGGCIVIGFQSFPQLRSRYGRDIADTICSLCGNKVILRNPDYDTAKWSSDILGYSEVQEYREGYSFGSQTIRDGLSINLEKAIKPIVLPAEIMNLNNLEGYLSLCNNSPLAKFKLKYYERDKIAARFEENSSMFNSVHSGAVSTSLKGLSELDKL